MLDPQSLEPLRDTKNLLAFSGGSDSTALFFLLLEHGIGFDLAHVNYHTREQSGIEAERAQALARRYGKRCFLFDAPQIARNFEAQARRIRYDFFESLIETHGYRNLVTAHQLDDRLEWLLMQLCKGAGTAELLGMVPVEDRGRYRLVRPLLFTPKKALKSWLEQQAIAWSEDESNADERHLRNRFRHRFAAPMIEEYAEGIARTFRYLQEDTADFSKVKIRRFGAVVLFESALSRTALMRAVDRLLKQEGYVMRRGEKERIIKENEIIIGRRYALSIGKKATLLAPLIDITVPKPFRDTCRRAGIGIRVRPYLFTRPDQFGRLLEALQDGNGF